MTATMSNRSIPMAPGDLGDQHAPRKPRIVCWGELLWDVFEDRRLLGGSSANVAFHAAALGAESFLVSRVGHDRLGTLAKAQLAANGVHVEHVSTDPAIPTGQVLVRVENGEPEFTILQPAAWDHIVATPEVRRLLESADAFCFSTLAQRTALVQGQLFEELSRLRRVRSSHPLDGKPHGRPLLILDLNLRPPFTDRLSILRALSLADVVKCNESELKWLEGLLETSEPIDTLFSRFDLRLLALTRGERGASLRSRHVRVDAPGLPVSGGDAVGAGDSFVASLSLSLCLGRRLPEALFEANRYAAWVAGQRGAMPAQGS